MGAVPAFWVSRELTSINFWRGFFTPWEEHSVDDMN